MKKTATIRKVKKHKKRGKISFRVIEGTGPLSISWSEAPKGDAIEAKNEQGVGFFSNEGELLSVEFDEVKETKDHQILEFEGYRVEVSVKKGKVLYSVETIKSEGS